MGIREQHFEADRKFAYRALQDARQYNTDTDPSGARAEEIYERVARARGMMQPWSTDGTAAQADYAVGYLRETTSVLSDKIGPASRRELPGQRQGGAARGASRKRPRPGDLERDVVDFLSLNLRPSATNVHVRERPVAVEPTTRFRVDVGGSGSRTFDDVAGALDYGVRRVYLRPSEVPQLRERLERGEPVAWSYGFASVGIDPIPGSAR